MTQQLQETEAAADGAADKSEEAAALESRKEIMGHLARRLDEGAKMVEIFGLDEATMTGLEMQAYQLYRRGRFSQAQVACRGVLALDGDRPLARLLMGDMALEEYRFSEAVDHLRRAHELVPDKLSVRARLGEALLKRGDAAGARPHLEAVAAGDSDADDGARQRCQALLAACCA